MEAEETKINWVIPKGVLWKSAVMCYALFYLLNLLDPCKQGGWRVLLFSAMGAVLGLLLGRTLKKQLRRGDEPGLVIVGLGVKGGAYSAGLAFLFFAAWPADYGIVARALMYCFFLAPIILVFGMMMVFLIGTLWMLSISPERKCLVWLVIQLAGFAAVVFLIYFLSWGGVASVIFAGFLWYLSLLVYLPLACLYFMEVEKIRSSEGQ